MTLRLRLLLGFALVAITALTLIGRIAYDTAAQTARNEELVLVPTMAYVRSALNHGGQARSALRQTGADYRGHLFIVITNHDGNAITASLPCALST